MGAYIQGPIKGKALYICTEYGATPLQGPPKKFEDMPIDKALICVMSNGPFEAAAFVYNASELHAFTLAEDHRPKTWLMMDRAKACELTGHKWRNHE